MPAHTVYSSIKLSEANSQRVKLDKAKTPSKPYIERTHLHCETAFEAEPMTLVTNRHQEEAHTSVPNFSFDPQTGTFKQNPKYFAVPMPRDAESLRARLSVLGVSYVFLKMR